MRNKHCYPKLTDNWIDSNWKELKCKKDIEENCMCTMQELCKALVDMKELDRQRLLNCIHLMTKDQIDLSF